jgi:glycine/D-amino acid oxidase-like deaminating enzyme
MSDNKYDYAVVGGGIAGLAIAEIFARSGHSVVLIERNSQLCHEASASQHGWFHFGSLYSIFPQNSFLRTMIRGVEDLREYYSGFPGMNIRATGEGRLAFPQSGCAWFRDEPIEYIVSARNDPDFDMRSYDGFKDYAQKLFFLATWELAIKQFISRHQRFHRHDWRSSKPASLWIPRAGFGDYSREVITKPNHPGIALDIDTHFRIVGYDRPMRASLIMRDLARGLLGAGGDIQTGVDVERIEKVGRGRRLVTRGGRAIETETVIIAAGKWLGAFLGQSQGVKVVASPLLVAYPAVSDRNFVRMTPFVQRSLNHLHHEIDGLQYSVIGGGYSANPNDSKSVELVTGKLLEMAQRVFPRLAEAKVIESYLGYKTEVVPKSGERNYQYFMRELDAGVYSVVPGKFSLAFSLAVNTYRRITGVFPAKQVKIAGSPRVGAYVGLTKHASLVQGALAGINGPDPSMRGILEATPL